jgi:phosphoheptose isomerase
MKSKELIKQIEKCFKRGGKIIVFGNGGSMAEASHFAAEFVGIGLPAISLSDPSMISALANDYGYEVVFERWVRAIAKPEDLLIGISSSGKSKNVNNALKLYFESIDFPRIGKTTSEIQNNQLKLIHIIYENFKYSAK